MSKVSCIVLAAGQGTRMRSDRPKALHEVVGKPMIVRLVESLLDGPPMKLVVVVGHRAGMVERVLADAFPGIRIDLAFQKRRRGTGHAVATGLGRVPRSSSRVVVVNGDLPLLEPGSVRRLLERHRRARAAVTLGVTRLEVPTGYGRILRGTGGRVAGIREERDCSPAELAIDELNAGLYCFSRSFLESNVSRLGPRNRQRELYLTDLVGIASASTGLRVADVEVDGIEVAGINTRQELARVEELLLARTRERIMRGGATIRMPHTVWIDDGVVVGRDTEIGPGAMLLGSTSVGSACTIGAGCIIADTRVEDGAVIRPYSMTEGSTIREGAVVGPFARLRPGSDVGEQAHVGNFVELKKTVIGKGSKANHLSYLGDGVIGRNVNVGAGTIFCNYDGFNKHTTVLEDDVFVGSDSQMVAPVTVGRGSYVGSGSTITSDVPPDSLALARARQVVKKGRATMLRELLGRRGPRSATGGKRPRRDRNGPPGTA